MLLSRYFLPLLKENPAEAKIVSHRLMLRAGMIRQLTSGIYDWLPLGLEVLRNVEKIIREEMNAASGVEVLMPTMQPIELWEESGRGGYGSETLKATDRHGRQMIYGPTHEEVITDLFRRNVKQSKQLPLILYQIQWKFRDEIRPRFGVMRGREFLMKDGYSFTETKEEHIELYFNMYRTYLRIFKRMGLSAIPFSADTGLIGGDLSHEFQVIAETGESEIFYDAAFEEMLAKPDLDIEAIKKLYSAADEKHDSNNCPVPAERLKSARGIEVGHIFYFDDKYSKPMKAMITNTNGEETPVKMGAHGIGVSRLLGAIIESSHDENGIIWPESVAPFKVGIINLRQGDAACDKACRQAHDQLEAQNCIVLYHDLDERAGVKFAAIDLIGLPWQLIIGPKGIAAGLVELKNRRTGEKSEISLEAALNKILG